MLLYLVALIPLLLLGVRQPMWSLVDESAHYDYVAQLAHGTVPTRGTPIRPETRALMEQTGVYRFYLDVPQPQATTVLDPPAAAATPAAWSLWSARHQWQWSSEAGTPPFYYVVSVPTWWLGDAVGGPVGAAVALRLENALIAALLAPIIFLLIIEVVSSRRRDIACWLALLMASLPGVIMALTSVTNVTLVVVASSGLLLVSIRSLRHGWSGRGLLGAGLLAAAAVATKSIAPGIAPAVLASLLWGVKEVGIRAVCLRVFIVGSVAATGFIPSQLLNHGPFRPVATATTAALASPPDPGVLPSTVDAMIHSIGNAVTTFVTGEPIGITLPPAVPLLTILSAGFVLVALLGMRRRHVDPLPQTEVDARLRRRRVAFLALAIAGQFCLSVWSLLGLHSLFAVPVPGRYIYPAVGGVAGLLALTVHHARVDPGRFRLGALLIIAASIATLELYPSRLDAAIQVTGPGRPAAHARTYGVHGANAEANGFKVQVDAVVRDRDAQWVHVTARNTGTTAAEWLPMANGTAGGITVAVTDYHHSSSIPEQILPGQSASGWLSLQSPPGTVLPAMFTLTFPDVATDSYRDVRSFEIAVTLR